MLERETIYQRVWGYAMAHGDRSVDVFIRKLRQKLEKRSPSWEYIHTHFGVGYRFDPEPARASSRSPRSPLRRSEASPNRHHLHRSFTKASPRRNRSRPAAGMLRDDGGRNGNSPQQPPGGSRCGRRSTRRWSTAARSSLTVRELQLLVTLWSNPQRILTREELFAAVWGTPPRRDDRSVDVYVSRLRAKLGAALPDQQLIYTHNGIGYRFSPDG